LLRLWHASPDFNASVWAHDGTRLAANAVFLADGFGGMVAVDVDAVGKLQDVAGAKLHANAAALAAVSFD